MLDAGAGALPEVGDRFLNQGMERGIGRIPSPYFGRKVSKLRAEPQVSTSGRAPARRFRVTQHLRYRRAEGRVYGRPDDLVHALLLGVLEGLTEFLPVSSTGHLYLFGKLLGHDDDASKALDIVMQLGAVIAVVVYYRARLGALVRGVLTGDRQSLRLLYALGIAFVPAAVVGLALHKRIKASLMSPAPIAVALIAGGILMIVVEGLRHARGADKTVDNLDAITPRRALAIGLAQCFALWPGASRSMVTIVGGQLCGVSTATAAEFSFLLSIPTLGAATVFDLLKHSSEITAAPGGGVALLVSMGVSFAVAIVVIAAFLKYLTRTGLAPFGYYRIALGAIVFLALFTGGFSAADAPAAPPSAASPLPVPATTR